MGGGPPERIVGNDALRHPSSPEKQPNKEGKDPLSKAGLKPVSFPQEKQELKAANPQVTTERPTKVQNIHDASDPSFDFSAFGPDL